MTQIILGICVLVVGIGLAFFGNYQNNDLEAQLSSLWNNGTANPGDIWLYAGVAIAIVGLVVIIIGVVNYNKSNKENHERPISVDASTWLNAASSNWQKRMIKEYAAQRKNGVITQDEFEQKCKEVLSN